MTEQNSEMVDLYNNINISEFVSYSKEEMHRIAIAPMLDVTYNHYRVFFRLLTRKTTMWTEMIHENAIINHE